MSTVAAMPLDKPKSLTRDVSTWCYLAELRTVADAFIWAALGPGLGLVSLTSLGVSHDQFNSPSEDVGGPDPTVPQGWQLREHPL